MKKIAIFIQPVQDTMYYVHKDYLGSWLCITNSSGAVVEERSFDACMPTISRFHWEKVGGRRRNPSDWPFTGLPSSYKFSHGYTTHEHLDKFGLINMLACHIPISSGGGRNGRMYDPVVGRFLSPDNFVQLPDFTQSYNRYAYCLNNPLKYTDPSGEKWKWGWLAVAAEILTGGGVSITSTIVGTLALITYSGVQTTVLGAQVTSTAIDFTRSSLVTTRNMIKDIFNPQEHIYEDDGWIFEDLIKTTKIEAGMFSHIPGWETEQTIIGNCAAHIRNMTGNVDNVEIKNWTVLINDDRPADKKGITHGFGFTLGPYINSQNINKFDGMYEHEYGHTIQSRILGPLYTSKVAIPSGYTNNFTSKNYHKNCWYEVWANRLGGAPQTTDYPRYYRHDNFWYWTGIVLFPFWSN